MSAGLLTGLTILFIAISLLPLLVAYIVIKKKGGFVNGKFQIPSSGPDAPCRTLSPREVREMIDWDKSARLVDVRTREEYEHERIAGSILFPVDDIETRSAENLPDKNAPIIVYSQSGVRSKRAAKNLAALGFRNVYDMGGITSWPYETIGSK